MGNKRFAKVFPPFIDAYKVTHQPNDEVTRRDFDRWMEQMAAQWGLESLGIQVLEHGGPLRASSEDEFVFACGMFGDELFVLVGKHRPYHDTRIERFDWPDEWNVT